MLSLKAHKIPNMFINTIHDRNQIIARYDINYFNIFIRSLLKFVGRIRI